MQSPVKLQIWNCPKEGTGLDERIHMKGPVETLEAQGGEETKSRGGTKGCGCSKLKLREESNSEESKPSERLKETEASKDDRTENSGGTEVSERDEFGNSGKPG